MAVQKREKKKKGNTGDDAMMRVGRFGLQKIILRTVAQAGMLSVAVLAPKALGVFAKLAGAGGTLGLTQRIEKSTQALVRGGELEWKRTQRGNVLRLTDKGERKLAKLSLRDISTKRRLWDQRWRIVLYDIRESKKTQRQFLRQALREIGFYRLQDSVWVYPHKCDELVLLLRAHFALGRDVQYLEVDHIENDTALIRHFHSIIL